MKRFLALAAVAIGLGQAQDAEWDQVTLTDGRVLEGSIQEEGDYVVLRLRLGQTRLHRSQISGLVDLRDPFELLDELEAARAHRGSADERRRYASFCAEHGFRARARRAASALLVDDPEDTLARSILGFRWVDGAWRQPAPRPRAVTRSVAQRSTRTRRPRRRSRQRSQRDCDQGAVAVAGAAVDVRANVAVRGSGVAAARVNARAQAAAGAGWGNAGRSRANRRATGRNTRTRPHITLGITGRGRSVGRRRCPPPVQTVQRRQPCPPPPCAPPPPPPCPQRSRAPRRTRAPQQRSITPRRVNVRPLNTSRVTLRRKR